VDRRLFRSVRRRFRLDSLLRGRDPQGFSLRIFQAFNRPTLRRGGQPSPPSPDAPDPKRVQQQLLLDRPLLPPLSTTQARVCLLQAVLTWFVFTSLTEPFPATQTLFAKKAALLGDRASNATTRAQVDAQLLAADPLDATPPGFVPAAREGAQFLSTVAVGHRHPDGRGAPLGRAVRIVTAPGRPGPVPARTGRPRGRCLRPGRRHGPRAGVG